MSNHSSRWNPDNLDARILELWHRGLDTVEIAEKVGRKEHLVYNRLFHIRNAA